MTLPFFRKGGLKMGQERCEIVPSWSRVLEIIWIKLFDYLSNSLNVYGEIFSKIFLLKGNDTTNRIFFKYSGQFFSLF